MFLAAHRSNYQPLSGSVMQSGISIRSVFGIESGFRISGLQYDLYIKDSLECIDWMDF